jgi:PAS domain S-box-containing protein
MYWQYNPYCIPLVAAGLIAMIVAILSWRRRAVSGALSLMLLALSVGVWSFGYAVELSSAQLPMILLWAKIQYLGIVCVPVIWLTFVLEYVGGERRLNARLAAALAIIPGITLAFVWTNERLGLIWREVSSTMFGALTMLDVTYGAWFWVHTGYSYTCLLAGSIVLVASLTRSQELYRRQGRVLLLGVLAPWIGNALYLTRLSPWPYLDLTPFAFTLSMVACAWGIFRLRLLDVLPIARGAILETMSDGIVIIDSCHRIIDINPAAQKMFCLTSGSTLGAQAEHVFKAFPDVVRRYYEIPAAVQEVALGEKATPRWYELRVSSVCDSRDRVRGWLMVWRDITDRKQAEVALREAKEAAEEANKAKSIFLARMSHELRTPLAAILGYCELLQREVSFQNYDSISADLKSIHSAGEHLLALINSILDLSKIEAGKMDVHCDIFSIPDLLDEVEKTTRPLFTHKDNQLQVSYDSNIGQMHADALKVRQVLLNLLSNAAKFTDSGLVTLRASRDAANSDWIEFCVTDTGIGIAPEELGLLFESFTQMSTAKSGRYGGAGLGLAISRHFCHLMGGDICVDSVLGQGSTFTVRLPAVCED